MSYTHVPESVNVPVKSIWSSKIVWTQVVGFGAMALSYFGIDLDADTQAGLLIVIGGVQSIVTWAFRTFGNKSVNPASLP